MWLEGQKIYKALKSEYPADRSQEHHVYLIYEDEDYENFYGGVAEKIYDRLRAHCGEYATAWTKDRKHQRYTADFLFAEYLSNHNIYSFKHTSLLVSVKLKKTLEACLNLSLKFSGANHVCNSVNNSNEINSFRDALPTTSHEICLGFYVLSKLMSKKNQILIMYNFRANPKQYTPTVLKEYCGLQIHDFVVGKKKRKATFGDTISIVLEGHVGNKLIFVDRQLNFVLGSGVISRG